jgi:hypothetical protein
MTLGRIFFNKASKEIEPGVSFTTNISPFVSILFSIIAYEKTSFVNDLSPLYLA